ncbi:MAG: hypothetical protein R3B09_09130 [Nannocystaceae bacterium]
MAGLVLGIGATAAAGARRKKPHFVALPYLSGLLDASEVRRELSAIPNEAEPAAPPSPDRRLAALDAGILDDARRGTSLWDGSCRWQGDAGCTHVEARAWPPLRDDLAFVGPTPRRERRVVEERDPVDVAHALAHLRRAERAWRQRSRAGGTPPPQVRRAAAWALFLLAERDFEALHASEAPRGLSFDTAEWMVESGVPEWEEEGKLRQALAAASHDRQYAHLVDVLELRQALVDRYREILRLHDLRSTIAVLARSASLADEWSVIVHGIRAPEVTTKGSRSTPWIRCIDPQEAAQGDVLSGVLRACVTLAERHNYRDDPFVRLCRRELRRLHPDESVEDHEIDFTAVTRPPRPERIGLVVLDDALERRD